MTAAIDLIVSSGPELVAEDISVDYEQKETTITIMASNIGVIDAENVKIQFFNGYPSGGDLLGEHIITIPSGEMVTASIKLTLVDGPYIFYVVVDPENSIPESCESNNVILTHYLSDHTPPELEIFFDPSVCDIVINGIDNLDSSVTISQIERPIKGMDNRIYILTDDTGNTTELQLEIKCTKHQIRARIVSLKYNDTPVILPENLLKVEYVIRNGRIKMLNQFLVIGGIKVHLFYNESRDQTKITGEIQEVQEGLVLLVIRTHNGHIQYHTSRMR